MAAPGKPYGCPARGWFVASALVLPLVLLTAEPVSGSLRIAF